jgi:ribosomal protein S18 acetylase RimI-like enzyme
MTGDTSYIDYLSQLKFYVAAKCKFKRMRATKIFIARYRSQAVGYLLIRRTDEGAFLTTAIDGRFRGRGIGKRLVDFAQRRYGDLIAEIRDDNAASIALHESMGFQREAHRNDILVYRFRRQ